MSETALNNPKRTSTTGGLSGAQSGSMSALADNRRDSDFGSNASLPNSSRNAKSSRNNAAWTNNSSTKKNPPARSQSPESVSDSTSSGE